MTRVDGYQYDSVVGTWQYPAAQTFGYDRWSNRQITAASGTGINNLPVTVDTATNRLGVPAGQGGVLTYDAAGNQTRDSYSTGLGGSSHQDAGKREYDNENRVTAAHDGTSWQQYHYNASGQWTKAAVWPGSGGTTICRSAKRVRQAQARYCSSVQGEFTSTDLLLASGEADNPQKYRRNSGIMFV